jgi:hypothetical protein
MAVTATDITIVRDLFGKFVKHKIFSPSHVTAYTGQGCPQFNRTWGVIPASPSLTLKYSHEGVVISYFRRLDTINDDTDYFVDYTVTVDGYVVHKVENEY